MRAVILVGHGSLRDASGEAMIRLAEHAQAQGLAPMVNAGFLNFSHPSFAETLEHCLERGASEIIVQPYFLISGYYVRSALSKLVTTARDRYAAPIAVAEAFGYHSALSRLARERALAAGAQGSALLLIAHGTPEEDANAPLHEVLRDLRSTKDFRDVRLAFMELNTPGIQEAIDELVGSGNGRITALPYFLHLGEHVAEDLPNAIVTARIRHTHLDLQLAEHLGYDPHLLDVIRCRTERVLVST